MGVASRIIIISDIEDALQLTIDMKDSKEEKIEGYLRCA